MENGKQRNRGESGLVAPEALVTEIKTAAVPELTRREQQAASAILIIALETLADEAEATQTAEFSDWKEIKKNSDLVILYLSWLAEGDAEQGEKSRLVSLEELKKPLVDALVLLFRRLPEFHRLCTQAPPVSTEDGSNEFYNPIYVAYQQAVRKLTKKPNGEDPAKERLRRERVKQFASPGTEKGIKIRNTSEPRALETASLKNIEIENGATALLEILREEKPFLPDEVLKKDAEVVEEFLELMSSPAAILSRHTAEDDHGEKSKLVELINRIPPQLGLAQLPPELFMSAQRLRAFNRRFNTACLGHNILHDQANADAFSANPLNVARAVSRTRVDTRSLDTSVADRYRLDAWDSLEPDAVTLQGAAFASHSASGEALAVVGTDLSLAGTKPAKGKLRRALDYVRAKIFRVAIEDWEREQAERKKEMLERAIQGDVEIYLAALNTDFKTPNVSNLINIVGVIIKEVGEYPGVARPELMEAMSETIAANFESLHPDYADYWHHIHRQIIAARDGSNSTRVEEWTKHILAEAEQAVKEIKTLSDNRFYYPEHVASFRKKRNYKKTEDFKDYMNRGAVVEAISLGQGRELVLLQKGLVCLWQKNANGEN